MKPAIVVTGASSGIGRALTLAAAPDAAVMVLIGLSPEGLDAVAAELAAVGVETHALAIDLADRDAARRIEEALSERGLLRRPRQQRRLRRVRVGGRNQP